MVKEKEKEKWDGLMEENSKEQGTIMREMERDITKMKKEKESDKAGSKENFYK